MPKLQIHEYRIRLAPFVNYHTSLGGQLSLINADNGYQVYSDWYDRFRGSGYEMDVTPDVDGLLNVSVKSDVGGEVYASITKSVDESANVLWFRIVNPDEFLRLHACLQLP